MKFLEFRDVPVAKIVVGPRLREVDQDWVDALAGMIREGGLQHPVGLFPVGSLDSFCLLAGSHRLEAFKKLKRAKIPSAIYAPETDNPALEARLHEIIENIGRRELSALDRAANLAELKRVYEELHPETRRGVAGGKARQKSASEIFSFAEAAAQKSGLSRRSIEIAVALHNGLDAKVRDALRALSIADNAAQLRALSKLSPEFQGRVVKLLASGDAKNTASAMAIMNGGGRPNADHVAFERLVKAWERAGAKARRRFLSQIGATVGGGT